MWLTDVSKFAEKITAYLTALREHDEECADWKAWTLIVEYTTTTTHSAIIYLTYDTPLYSQCRPMRKPYFDARNLYLQGHEASIRVSSTYATYLPLQPKFNITLTVLRLTPFAPILHLTFCCAFPPQSPDTNAENTEVLECIFAIGPYEGISARDASQIAVDNFESGLATRLRNVGVDVTTLTDASDDEDSD